MRSANTPTKIKSALTLTLASTILGATAITSASAADNKTIENLSGNNGDVISVETSEAEAFKANPVTGEKPKTGGDNPGAVMGQSLRGEQNRTGYTPESSKAVLQEIADVTPDKDLAKNIEEKLAASDTSVENGGAAVSTWKPAGIQGMDVSGHQPVINWSAEWSKGSRFAYVKATEGTYYKSEAFRDQYSASYNVGMIRGSYHFAYPEVGTGATQADFFINNGGGWSADGKTLPGLLDVEYNPYGQICYDMNQAQMRDWIRAFSDRYKQRTGRLPAIYSTTNWWKTCTGNTTIFNDHPLHIAAYNNVGAGELFAGRTNYDIWQYSDSGPFAGDSNQFAGSTTKLTDLALNKNYVPIGGKSPVGASQTTPTPEVIKSTLPEVTYTVKGGILGKYRQAGGEGALGTAIMNERGDGMGGVYQEFKKGSSITTIYWTPAHGSHIIKTTGGIGKKWVGEGKASGIGHPTTDEVSRGGGVVSQTFKKGGTTSTIYWKAGDPTSVVKDSGGIGNKWRQLGGLGSLGNPITDEQGRGDGVVSQSFKKGSTVTHVFWKSGLATEALKETTGIGGKWKAMGGFDKIGMPTSGEVKGADGTVYQNFKKGSVETTIVWKSGSPTVAIKASAGIGTKWKSMGGFNGLGYPTTDEQGRGDGVVSQSFKKGNVTSVVYWKAGTPTIAMTETGDIHVKWRDAGGLNGYGKPISEKTYIASDGSFEQRFQKGGSITLMVWTAQHGAHAVKETGDIGKLYLREGGSKHWGHPTTDETTDGREVYQKFSKGTTLYWSKDFSTIRAVS